MPPQQGPPPNVVDHASYLKSASIRKKIELKITSGISTPRDLKNLQFHTQIMDDYERNLRYQKKLAAKGSKESPAELRNLQRYRSALGIVQKLKKRPQGTLTPEEKKTLASNKVIVDEFEAVITASQAVKGRGGKALPAGGSRPDLGAKAYERKKQQLLREAKKNYPNDFRLSGAAKRKMRSLVAAGIETEEAKLLALHSALVVKELISLKNATIRNGAANGADRNKQLVPVGNFKPGATKGKPNPAGNPKPAVPVPVDPAAGRIHEMSKKERAGMRSANRLLFNYESNNADIESLTERDIALLRMSLRRLKVYHEKYDTPLRETKFDVLLSDKYAKKKDEDKSEGKEDKEEAMEEGNNDDAEGGEDAGQEDDQAEGDGEGAAEGEGEEAAEGDGDAEEEAVDDQAEEEEE